MLSAGGLQSAGLRFAARGLIPKCAVMAWNHIPNTHISVSPGDILWSTSVLFFAINHSIHEPKTFFFKFFILFRIR